MPHNTHPRAASADAFSSRPSRACPQVCRASDPPTVLLPPPHLTFVSSRLLCPQPEKRYLFTRHRASPPDPPEDSSAAYLSPRSLRLPTATASRSSLPTAAQQPAFSLSGPTRLITAALIGCAMALACPLGAPPKESVWEQEKHGFIFLFLYIFYLNQTPDAKCRKRSLLPGSFMSSRHYLGALRQ